MKSTQINRILGASSRHRTTLVGIYYLLTILTGAFLLLFQGRAAFVTDIITSAFYLGVTAVFYDLSRQVNRVSGRKQ